MDDIYYAANNPIDSEIEKTILEKYNMISDPNQADLKSRVYINKENGEKHVINTESKKHGVFKDIIHGRNHYSENVKKMLEKYGNESIYDIFICRTPLPKLLTLAANAVTLGEFEKNNPYDTLFHLFMKIR